VITAITIKCDWHGCKATLNYQCGKVATDLKGWKREDYSLHSLHLCPDHRRHSWFEVKQQPPELPIHSTP